MKKLLFLFFLMTISLGQSQTLTGRWKVTTIGVGPNQGDIGWYNLSVSSGLRACYFDDEYVFGADGTFSDVLGSQTYNEGWLGNGCGAPVSPFDGSYPATYTTDGDTVTLTGTGAYIGLPKAINGSEIGSTSAHPGTVTYKIASLSTTTLTLDINVGFGWWRYVLAKQAEISASAPVITGFESISKLNNDAPFVLTDPTSNSAGAFSYTSSNEAVATISGSTVTIVGVGVTTITASQAANGNYDAGSTSAQLVVTYAPPSTAAPVPSAKNAWDVVSIYTDGTYADKANTKFYPNWGQSTQYEPFTLNSNTALKYSNLNYQGVEFDGGINVSAMTTVHFDIWTADCSSFQFFLIGGGQNSVTLTPTLGSWNSYDIPLSSYSARTLNNIIQLMFTGNGTVYLDNIYFSRPTTSTPSPTLGTLTVPAQIIGAAPFELTAPTTNSSGAFTYTSSNESVATISGTTVTVVGIGTSIISATQAAAGDFGEGTATAQLIVDYPAPTVAAPTPTRLAENVISIFSNAYTDKIGTAFKSFGGTTIYSPVNIDGNSTNKYKNFDYVGNTFSAGGVDASTMDQLHIDIWTPNCTTFNVFVLDGGAEHSVTLTPSLNGWNSYDIPLSSYSGLNKSHIVEFKYDNGQGSTIYLDNIYFWKLPAGTLSYYVDADGDGYGAGLATESSTPIVGSVTNSGDCNDANAAVHPGATEIADGIDNNCDGKIDEGFPPSVAAPTPPARNAWDVKSIFGDAYSNVTLNEFPTSWSDLAEPSQVVTIAGNNTLKFKGQFLGMVTNYDSGVDLSKMTTMHIDYWTEDTNRIDLKLVNTVNGGDVFTALENPTVTGTWRSIDVPLSAYGSLNLSKITQILIDPAGVSTVYVDNFYFYRAATGNTYYVDADHDGYGAGAAVTLEDSTAPTGYSVNNTDCNDSNASINPGATEVFDTIDNNCDTVIDEGTTLGAPVVTNVNVCKGTGSVTLTATALPEYTLTWYSINATTGKLTKLTAAPSASIGTVGSKSWKVSQKLGTATESPLATITVNVLALPTEVIGAITSATEVTATPGTYAAAIKAIGPYVNTQTTVSYRVPAFSAGLSYYWTVPAGVSIVGQAEGVTSITQTGTDANILNVNFKNVSSGTLAVGSITVQAKNDSGCLTAAKGSVALTKALPTAPSSIKVTDASMVVPVSGIPTAVTSFAKYMGRSTELTLTATLAATATSYIWELPTGVNITNNSATTVNGVTSSTSNVITVNFEGVSSSNTFNYSTAAGVSTNVLRIGVKSSNGVGISKTSNTGLTNSSLNFYPNTTSEAKLLSLTAVAPAKPGTITASTGNVCSVVGTSTNVTYTVAPVKDAYANGYTWTVPNGASIVGTSNGNSISVSYSTDYAAAGSVTVTASNGVGTSAANSLAISRVANATPVSISGGTTYSTCDQTFTTPEVSGATSYTWEVPKGATIISQSANSVVVNYGSLKGNQTIKVKITNACGLISSSKSLTLTSGTCPTGRFIQSSNVSVIGMYPNPTTDTFNLELSATKSSTVSVTVYSFDGVVVSSKNVQLSKGSNVLNEDLSSQRNGIYLVKIIDSSTGLETIKKIIKQ